MIWHQLNIHIPVWNDNKKYPRENEKRKTNRDISKLWQNEWKTYENSMKIKMMPLAKLTRNAQYYKSDAYYIVQDKSHTYTKVHEQIFYIAKKANERKKKMTTLYGRCACVGCSTDRFMNTIFRSESKTEWRTNNKKKRSTHSKRTTYIMGMVNTERLNSKGWQRYCENENE